MSSDMISKNDFFEMLLDNVRKKKEKNFCLYIHSPFCVRQCSFCMHKGALIKINDDVYKKYYEQYLPRLIDFYKPILLERTPDSVYFGGGTSSIMTAEVMRNIFTRIPNFKDIKEKIFECNMLLLNEEKIKILREYDFTHISLGIQTFNERILKKNNRSNPKHQKIKEIVSNLQAQDFFVNCDLMTFIDNGDETDINDTINDLIFMSKYIKPNRMTLYPKREALTENPQRGIEKIILLRKMILKNMSKLNGYILPQVEYSPKFFQPIVEEVDFLMNYAFYRSKDDFLKRNQYDSSAFINCPCNRQTVLGLGDYNCNCAYSYTDDIYVEERNLDWKDTMYLIIRK